MVNEYSKPHGWGRAIYGKDWAIIDGQFDRGKLHGIIQYLGPRGGYELAVYKNNKLEEVIEKNF